MSDISVVNIDLQGLLGILGTALRVFETCFSQYSVGG